MKPIITSFAAGGLFAIGLGIAGMTKPSKVVAFLDLFGAWDPSLAFVMVGAIAVYFVSQRAILRRKAPLFDGRFHLPTRKDIDLRLVVGATIFGAGWGLGGYCPGPGLVSAASGDLPGLLFVIGMALGVVAEHAALRARALRSAHTAR